MSLRLADFIFLFLAALLCVAAYHGTWALSPSGVFMDSDLQNYTQIFAARLVPGDFAHDPLVRTYKAFPGEPSLLTLLARLLEWGDGAVAAIFRAGALGIWLHLATYYMLGRWLIKSPGLAALFSLGMSVTIYWAFGTFWGPRMLTLCRASITPIFFPSGLCWAARLFAVQACALCFFLPSACPLLSTVSAP